MMKQIVRILCVVTLIALSSLSPILAQPQRLPPQTLPNQNDPTPTPTASISDDEIDRVVAGWLETMTVADRVGQLFLIGFSGNNVEFESDIAELVYGYRIGGVVLSPQNGNFSNEKGVDTPRQVATLINRLQALAYGVLLPAPDALLPYGELSAIPGRFASMEQLTGVAPVGIPLWIAVEQIGDGPSNTNLRRGFTPLPSQMALGATWNPDLTRRVGQIIGRELEAVGVNMLLGPGLDVVEQPRPDSVGALGLHSFGGDPNWVGQMGRAYIAGVHEGSAGQVAVIARNFPGAGDTDRMPNQEVATVQRSLDGLERVALPPFRAVAQRPSSILSAEGDPAATDGFLSSHLRYSALQGGGAGRNTPISLAPELEMLVDQEGFTDWRDGGGLLVSNALGVPAIRRYYSPNLTEFPHRRLALDAFSAGHDLLYLGQFSLDNQWATAKSNIQETIGFFQERYVNDTNFAARVDLSVQRLLRLKARLYLANGGSVQAPESSAIESAQPAPDASAEDSVDDNVSPIPLDRVLVQESDLDILAAEARANALATISQVARESISLLYPDPSVAASIPSLTPQTGDRLLIFTESRLVRECETCIAEAAVGPDELKDIIIRLYGPAATGQLSEEQVTSLTFADLDQLLDAEEGAESTDDETPVTTEPPVTATVAPATATPAQSGTDSGALDKNAKTDLLIDEADWIIFAMLDVNPDRHPYSDAVKRFLRMRNDMLGSKQVIVLSLHAPFFLDATEISRLSAYLGVYSKTQPFLEGAVRALFRAYSPTSAPPVSVPGTRFGNLAERLSPDPTRRVELRVTTPDGGQIAGQSSANGAAMPVVEAGNVVRLSAGPILDLNGKPVHDGVAVEFILAYDGEETTRSEVSTTHGGMAIRDFRAERAGVLRATARVGEITNIDTVALNVQGSPTQVTAASTPASLTETVSPVASLVLTTTQPLSMTEVAATTDGEPVSADDSRISLATLAIALLTIVATMSLLLTVQVHVLPRRTLVHSMLWAVNFGLAAYILYGLNWMPGGSWLHGSLRIWGAGIVVFVAMLPPLLWLQLRADT